MSSAVQHHPLITTKKYNRRQTRKSRHLSYLNSPLGESHLPTFLPTRISLCIFALLIVSSLPAIECAANVQLTETLHVREEQSIGTVVARLGNHPQAPPPFMATLWTPSIGSTIFSVDNAGVFTLLARLDRETGSAWYAVVLQSMKTYVGVKVVLNVTDFNDHSPTFSFKEFTQLVRVDETTPTDTRLILGSVSDRDLSPSPNSHLKCRLENGEPKFRLITSSLARGASELSLYLQLAEQLDYETRKRFSMRLVCSDSGLIKKIETTRGIEVVVLDSNDNAPVFSSLTYSTGSSRGYEVKVGENATRGHVVIRVNATDRDSGENGRVTYRLNPILDSNGKPDTTFILNSTSGELIVNGPLDAETKSTYELVVVAEDNGHHRLTDSVVIRVEVMDLNDNAPRIAMQYLTDSGGSQVTLDTLVTGDFIARFSVTDEDGADATAEFTVKLLNNPDNVFSLIRREHNVYFLAVNRVPSTSRVFSLRLRVIDSSGLASQIAFQVRTSRSSDPTPESPDGGQAAGASAFATDFYAFTLADTVSLKPGDHVMDLNLGLHSSDKRTDVRYSSSDPRFAVNSTSSSGGGHLEVTELWRGQSCGQDPISFTLTAHWQLKDAAKTPMKDNCTVTLTWFPVVNTRPRFHLKTFYEMPPLTLDTQLGTCFDLPVSVPLVMLCNRGR